MFDLLFIVSIVGTCAQLIKESFESTVPAEKSTSKYIRNKDTTYPKPHRGEDGRIIIENCLLYKKDLFKYGSVQTMKWVEQGKYNLNSDELEKEHKRIEARYKYLYDL